MDDLTQDAISAALKGNWSEAVVINDKILNGDAENTDALIRLARAHAELGNLSVARKICQKVLKVDPFNNIAARSLEKWKGLKKGEIYKSLPSSPQIFLEEPGKTKIPSLLFLGSPNVLAKLDSADEVKFDTHTHRVNITTKDNKYIGRLPDDLSARLKKMMRMGNEYQVFIKSVQKTEVKVFIRETKRDKRLTDVPSFSSEKIDYVSFTSPELVHKKVESPAENESEE